MRRKLISGFVIWSALLCATLNIKAQTAEEIEIGRYAMYVDAGTNIFLSSATLNLEVKLGEPVFKKVNWYARGAFAGAAVFYGDVGLGGLAGVTMLTGRGNHHFEASAGGFFGNDNGAGLSGGGFFALPVLDVGYRFQKPKKSFVFRAKVGILGIGIGLGYAF